MRLRLKNGKSLTLFENKGAKIGDGPMGLIKIKTDTGMVFVNSNGIFSSSGEKITTGKAKEIIGL